jgi:tetratricopeptide (TPR) repeat protein
MEDGVTKKTIVITILAVCLTTGLQASVRGKIEGVVVDDSGTPVEGVEVLITSIKMSSRSFKTKTNGEGNFTQIGLWPEFYQVSFKKDGFLPASQEVRVRIDETRRLEVTLHKAEQAIRQQLSEADRKFVKGNDFAAEGKLDEAIEAYREAVTMSPEHWAYHFNLGLALKKAGRSEDAMAAFGKAVELNPESFFCNKEYGEALAKAQRFDEARPYYDKAVGIDDEDADTNYNYGLVLLKQGESEPALQAFRKTVALQEDYADAYYQIGTIHVGRNETAEAVAALEKFLELAPEHPQAGVARQLLDFLKQPPRGQT